MKRSALALLALGALSLPSSAEEIEKKDRGKIEVALRWRYEDVSTDAFAKDGRASTLRSSLAYDSPSWRGFGFHAEFEDVRDLGLDDRHANGGAGSLTNGVVDRPVIADPESTEVNQAYLRFERRELSLDAGRMEMLLADERFVGPGGFRQNHQSFDGARLSLAAIPHATLFYGFVGNLNRTNGGNDGMSSHLLDVVIDLKKSGKLAPYAYILDYDATANAGLSTQTYGARWDGAFEVDEDASIVLHAEAALQSDTGDNPARVDTDYWRLEAALARKSISFGVGWEVLGGSPGSGAFQTPLATLHKFNGFADMFLTTPPDGLVDAYGTVAGKASAFSWIVAFHSFESDADSASYGSELDAEVTWRSSWKQTFGVAYADYDADELLTDTRKLWLFTTYRFGAKL